MKHNQRKHFFINKNLQGRYIVYTITILSVVSVLTGLAIYFGIWNSVMQDFSQESIKSRLELSTRLREYSDAREEMTQEEMTLSMVKEIDLFSAREREILNEILQNTYKHLTPLLIVLFLLIGWGSVYITHKIAGPLFRFEDSLRKLSDGKLNFKVKLRKNDQAQQLVPLFNVFIFEIDKTIGLMKRTLKDLKPLAKTQETQALIEKAEAELSHYETSSNE